MDTGLLLKLFGNDQRWHPPCTIIVNAEASHYTLGQDALLGGGAKQYAPRIISGRIQADAVCLVRDAAALLIYQQLKQRQQTGEEVTRQTLMVVDPGHVVSVEFSDTNALAALGVGPPVSFTHASGSHPGITPRPNRLDS